MGKVRNRYNMITVSRVIARQIVEDTLAASGNTACPKAIKQISDKVFNRLRRQATAEKLTS